jgi:hypothetical protein
MGRRASETLPRSPSPEESSVETTRRRPPAAVLLALLGAALAGTARAEPPASGPASDAPLAAGVVARVRGHDVTFAEFHRHLARRLGPELDDEKSPTSHTFRMAVEEKVVEQEARRLGIAVTEADVDARRADIETALREKSGGRATLDDLMRSTQTSPEEFRRNLRMQVTKEKVASHAAYLGPRLPKEENARLAQIEVVMGQILARAKVERDALPEGVVARVNGEPFTEEELGKAIDLRMRTAKYLAEYVQSLLLRDLSITDEEFDAAVARDRAVFERMRALDPQPEMRTVTYEQFLEATQGRPLEVLRRDPYYRGITALKARVRSEVTDDDVRKEWVANATKRYGAVLHVLDLQVTFKIPNAVVEPVQRRSREEAQRLVADYARRIREGEPVERIVAEIEARKTADGRPDRSIQAVRRAVRDVDNAQIVFQHAIGLKDGEWSRPFETISEFHLVRRDRLVPAPTFEEAAEQVRQDLVIHRANRWLHDQLNDPAVVRIASK